jgi:hypothetical protein
LHDLFMGIGGPTGRMHETVCMPDALPPSNPLHTVVRSKGIVWLAAPLGVINIVYWAQAGRAFTFEPGEAWVALQVEMLKAGVQFEGGNEEPEQQAAEKQAEPIWDATPGVGDRETELVLIGVKMDGPAVLAALQSAVLTASEWAAYLADAAIVESAEVATIKKESEKDSDADESPETTLPVMPDLATIESAGWTGAWDFTIPDQDHDDAQARDDHHPDQVMQADLD